MQKGGGMNTMHAINKTKVGESNMAYNLDVDNNKENKDRMEMELARDKNMDEDGTVASKTSGSNPVMLGGDNPVKPVGGSHLVDGEQAREEGEIEEREANLNEDLLVTIENNEQINIMATHIMERIEDDEGVKEIDEEIREETREHDFVEVDTIVSDTEVEGTVEELGNIRDCISNSEQRAQQHTRKIVHKVRSSTRVPSRPSRLTL
ncbi:Hypothetical predicted protein [Olea europaea subsp. europaea]|uniref:Uncharacterized protein n=1 Tax=Olea europaea subsp. europaea TaxID=158383 RepID=A0A8S0UCR1_OLEEU|nr:Hypothetical predicted protein [Olea europaea subsp. europaea]CAA3016389.1 Hypothetical predicted protein [Olea europaea subsp. europaea]